MWTFKIIYVAHKESVIISVTGPLEDQRDTLRDDLLFIKFVSEIPRGIPGTLCILHLSLVCWSRNNEWVKRPLACSLQCVREKWSEWWWLPPWQNWVNVTPTPSTTGKAEKGKRKKKDEDAIVGLCAWIWARGHGSVVCSLYGSVTVFCWDWRHPQISVTYPFLPCSLWFLQCHVKICPPLYFSL